MTITQGMVFWKHIKNLGIFDARTTTKGISADNSNRPYFSWSEEEEMNQLAELGEAWSTQAAELKQYLQLERHQVKKTLREAEVLPRDQRRDDDFILGFFRDLSFKQALITKLDSHLRRFHRLEELNVTGNQLTTVANLPKNLKVLNAYANQIGSVGVPEGPVPPLLHLGLGYNVIKELDSLLPFVQSLLSLDLSFNHLSSLADVCRVLAAFPRLTHLWLAGNPLCLAPAYRSAVLARLPTLEMLDGVVCEPPAPASGSRASTGTTMSPPVTASRETGSRESKTPGKGTGVADKKKGKEEEEKARLEAEQVATARDKEKKDKEEFACFVQTEAALDTTIRLAIGIEQLYELTDPSLQLLPEEEDGGDGKGKGKDKKAKGKDKKGGGGGAKRGLWEEDAEVPGRFCITSSEESVDEDENKVVVDTTKSKAFGYLIKYRLEGDEIFETEPVAFVEEGAPLALNHLQNLEFKPTPVWRDFLQVAGLDLLLYLRETTATEIKTNTHVRPVGAPPVDPKAKKGKADKEEGEIKTEVTTASSTEETLLGVVHLDLGPVVRSCRQARSVVTLASKVDLDDTWDDDWDPAVQRRVVQPALHARPGSSLGKRASISNATAAAAGVLETGEVRPKKALSYRIALNFEPAPAADTPPAAEEAAPAGKGKGKK